MRISTATLFTMISVLWLVAAGAADAYGNHAGDPDGRSITPAPAAPRAARDDPPSRVASAAERTDRRAGDMERPGDR